VTTVTVGLPHHLRTLAGVGSTTSVEVGDAPCIGDVLDALERTHPQLRGTIRDPSTGRRRPFMRYFMCEEDVSHEPLDTPVAAAVIAGTKEFRVLGAIAGGS
jgi:hypothetical protein